ncbi:MAG: RNA-binding protein, partial [Proteobacteria bacterium]|nr:RNA-binding protein [Pseudomonadota bacterium]
MSTKLFVRGLPWATDGQGLRETFEQFGTVSDSVVVTDRETGKSRGFGFVTFENDAEAKEALRQMDGAMLGGRTIQVKEAEDRPRRPGGGGRGGRGGYGGGRGGYGGGRGGGGF